MDHKQTYSLWLRPFGDVAFSLQERIKKLSKQYNAPLFSPHVTLLGGMHYGETELIQLTDTLAGTLHPFDIVLTRAGYRNTFYQALYVHASKSEELLGARRMAERLYDHHPEEDFMPHLSLMYGDFSREEKERILNVMGREFHIRFPVHNVLLIETSGKPANWKEIHSAEFKK